MKEQLQKEHKELVDELFDTFKKKNSKRSTVITVLVCCLLTIAEERMSATLKLLLVELAVGSLRERREQEIRESN